MTLSNRLELKMTFDRFIALFFNLSCPGCGVIYLGYKKIGALILFFTISSLPFLCWTRVILTSLGFFSYLLLVFCLYILSFTLCIIKPTSKHTRKKISIACSLLTILTVWLFGFSLFKEKNQLLGIDLYFIPSMSMYPTLQPGDVILTDTWNKNANELKVGDIVVFNLDTQLLVKRISEINKENYEIDYIVLGDNSKASRDSRSFGAIHASQIEGKATQVLFSLNPELRLRWSRFGITLIKDR